MTIHQNNQAWQVVFINEDGAIDLTPYVPDVLYVEEEPSAHNCLVLALGAAVASVAAWWYGKVVG